MENYKEAVPRTCNYNKEFNSVLEGNAINLGKLKENQGAFVTENGILCISGEGVYSIINIIKKGNKIEVPTEYIKTLNYMKKKYPNASIAIKIEGKITKIPIKNFYSKSLPAPAVVEISQKMINEYKKTHK